MVNRGVCERTTILVLLALIVTSLSTTRVSAYEIGVYTFCKDVDKSTDFYKPIHPTNVFEATDKQVYFMIVFYNITKPNQIIVKWIQPNGTLARTETGAFDDPRSSGYDYWTYYNYYSYLDLPDKPPPGQYELELYIDNKLEVSEPFEIQSTSPQPQQTQTVTATATATATTTSTIQNVKEIKADTTYLNLLYLTIAALAIGLIASGVRLLKKPKAYPQEQNIRYCGNCGKALRPNASYCTFCGETTS